MLSKKFSLGLAACLGLTLIVPAQANELGRRYLAVDQSLHGAGTTLDFVMGQSSGHQELIATNTWELNEGLFFAGIQGVTQGPDNVYRMYYGLRGDGNEYTALATSNDGINWTPQTTNVAFAGSNLISLAGETTYATQQIFYDAQDGDYKMMWKDGSTVNVARSNDGLNFTTSSSNVHPTWAKGEGGYSVFYDTIRNEYVAYGRIRGGGTEGTGGWDDGQTDRRGVALSRSANWDGVWSHVGQTVVDPHDHWTYTTPPSPEGTGPDVYQPNAQEYHGQYIGLPSVFFRDSDRIPHTRPERTTGTGPIYPMLMHSLDGENWTFPDPQNPGDASHSIIDLTPHERINQWQYATNQTTAEVGQIYPSPNFIEVGNELYIYYKWRDDTHYEAGDDDFPNPYYDSQIDEGIAMQKLRVDGFASMKSDGAAGNWYTGNLVVPNAAKGLLVNADVEGSLQVEVLDAGGTPIANLTLADSVAFQGDETSAFMQWSAGQFKDVAGQEVQLRFVVEDGEVYSFAFTAIPEPASLTLLGLGGAMLLRRKRA